MGVNVDGGRSDGLVVAGLRVGYGGNEVVHGVSLTVPSGGRVALLGPNGAGKSTILRAVSGLLRPRGGSISIDGARCDGRSPADVVKLGVAHVPEGRRVFAGLSVDENLRIANYGRSRAHLARGQERVFAAFPVLAERRQQAAGLLSGGQQQMLALGRAIIAQPKVLLLDEMSLGLAPILVKQIYATLDTLFSSEVAMLIVEQNAHIALAECSQVYFLRNGEIAASGDAQRFRAAPDLVREAYLGPGQATAASPTLL